MAKEKRLNRKIWSSIHEFILHWDVIKNKPNAVKRLHPIEITSSQWMSLASFHELQKKHGDGFIQRMIRLELNDPITRQRSLLTLNFDNDIIRNGITEDKKAIKTQQKKWNKRLNEKK